MAKILVVDDELDIVETIRCILEAKGHDVLEANDGMAALEQTKNGKPDIIFLDVMMPGLDGYKVCRMLKYDSEYRDIPIVMLTARASSQDREIGKEAGADMYITKPFDIEEVLDLIEKLLENGDNDLEKSGFE
jgi:DNA-binding response OmpR family regulator